MRDLCIRGLLPALVVACGLAFVAGCGSGSSGGGEGGLSFQALWEQGDGGGAGISDGGFGTTLPASVKTVRLLFESESDFRCCVAIDPDAVPVDENTGQRSVLMGPLPAGSGLVTLSGFPADFAPTEPNVRDTCAVSPSGAGSPCSLTQVTAPSFESDANGVTIVAGVDDTDAGDILVRSLPFLVTQSLIPAPQSVAGSPFVISFTVAEAISGVDAGSVAVQYIDSNREAHAVEVDLSSCDDFGAPLCSPNGELGVAGFLVSSTDLQTAPAGITRVTAAADNLAAPPRSLGFAWQFQVP